MYNALCHLPPYRMTICCPKETQQISLSLWCPGLMWKGWRSTSTPSDSNMVRQTDSHLKTLHKELSSDIL